MISVSTLTKAFGEIRALAGVDLEVAEGTVFALLGPNGAGKTTLVRILATLMRPDGGTATVAGVDVVRHPREVRSAISLTGQFAAVDDLLTGEENLHMMGRLLHLRRAVVKARTRDLLEQFDLADAARRPVKTYSGGMQRRLDIAISLLGSPKVIFLDEPTTGLDPRSRLAVWDRVRELVANGVTILLTTQYLEEADQLADQVAVIDHGRIIASGKRAELKQLVPGGHIELTFTSAGEMAAAQALLANAKPGELSLTIPANGSVVEVKQLLDRLDGVEIATLTLSKPTLDDVFLTLTGK
ncbi:MAG TPA: daunorubicin/doxorubicin resistance ABC transporter ATP-binding protein DrrA [Micromonosporaceae bacterium]|nr:daunorubicin/doxorubicin resistance ABC transporter ATP-binding protein DrrA [Micromonosporaceae bacterium]